MQHCDLGIRVLVFALVPLMSACASIPGQISASGRHAELERQQAAVQEAAHAAISDAAPEREQLSLEERLKKGDALHRGGSYANAMWNYLKAHELDVENPEPISRMASLHLITDPDLAESIFQDLLVSHPESGAAYTGLGLVRISRHDWSGAQESLELAVANSPHSATAHSALGVCLDRLGEQTLARASYEKATALHPRYYEALNNLGVSYLSTGEFEAAAVVLRRASLQEKRDPAVFNNLGVALGRLERYDDALDAFRLAGPEQAARSNVGYVAYLNEDYDRAFIEYEAALLSKGEDRLAVLRNLNVARVAAERHGAAGDQ